jgi:hypothetical protein
MFDFARRLLSLQGERGHIQVGRGTKGEVCTNRRTMGMFAEVVLESAQKTRIEI